MYTPTPLVVLFAFGAALTPRPMGTEQFGNRPVANNEEWAAGVLAIANDRHRTYTRWVNGNEDFYFCGNATAVNEALKRFAAVKAPRRVVTLLPGRGLTRSFKQKPVPYDWRLHAPSGIYLAMLRHDGNAMAGHSSLEVRIDGKLRATDLTIPVGVTLLRPQDLVDRYLPQLEDKNSSVAGRAAMKLGDFAYVPGVVEVLTAKLRSDAAYVRQCVAAGLARGGADALPAAKALERCRDRAEGNERKYLEARLTQLRAAPKAKPAEVAARARHLQAINKLCAKRAKR